MRHHRRVRPKLVLGFVIGILALPLLAAERPVIGLVLGGGGARGGAHLGVLEVLDELRIPFHCIAGTSMGALIGGAYAAGVSPAEMRERIGKTDWSTMFDDNASRELQNMRRRAMDDRFFSGLEFGVTDEGLRYREGAIAGEKIKLFFSELVRADLGERNIEQLGLPLTLIATDIVTGERVAMRSGNLTSAMRASMSVPGAIAPVLREGHKLVDGGLVDNVPIQEVRDRCKADVVIAINVGSPMLKGDSVAGAVSVVAQMVNLLTEQNVQRSLALLTPRDVYMRPELGDISAMDFGKQLDAAAIGRATALAQAGKLRALSVPPAEYVAWRSTVHLSPQPGPPVIDEVVVAETRYVNPRDLRESVSQTEGETLDTTRLAEDLVNIFSRGDLQSLDYSVLKERDKTILKLVPLEKPWGPDYLRFGLNLATDFRSESSFNLRALYRKTWINGYGGEWLTTAQVGSEEVIATEFYQPVDFRQRWFVRPYFAAARRKVGVFFDGNQVADYIVREDKAGLSLGANLGAYGQFQAGWVERKVSSTLHTGAPSLPESEARMGAIVSSLRIDQNNYAFFPSKGYKIDLDYLDVQNTTGGRPYAKVETEITAAIPVTSRFTILPTVAAGDNVRGNLPLYDSFALGGLAKLSAFAPGQILTEKYTYASVRTEYRLLKPVPVIGLSVLAGLRYERANVKNPSTEPNLRGNIDSYGFYLGATSALGPLYVGWSGTSAGDRGGRIYFFIGTP